MYDLIIKNATIVDGSGEKPYKSDLAVKNKKIAHIANEIDAAEGKEVIDATGLMVAPGFIDWHSHSDLSVLMGFDAPNILQQGITLEIAGHCGVSAVPLAEGKISNVGKRGKPELFEQIEKNGGGFKALVDVLKTMELPTNIASFVGHGNLRAKVMKFEDRDPTEGEMEQMKELLRADMKAGAMGMTTGLIYPPGSYSKPAELSELAKVTTEFDGAMYTTHMRNEGDLVVESVKEALDLGEKANIPVVISHHKIAGKHNKGKSVETLRLIDEAKARGQIVHLDQYPFDGGATSLMSSLPPKYATEGQQALIEKLKDPSIRAEITPVLQKPSTEFDNMIYNSGMDGVIVTSSEKPEINGKTLLELANEAGKDPYENMYDLMVETGGQISAIYRMISVWDMENILRYPYTMAGIDGSQSKEINKNGHPRGVATYTKLIGEFCRDKGFWPIETCIHRFTGRAAAAAGFPHKGLIKTGMDADLVIFDFKTISGKANYGKSDTPNEGIKYVFVNGVKAVEDGKITGAKGGKVLLRGGIDA